MRAWLALGAALACVSFPNTARTEPSLDLDWTAPAGCPDRGWVLGAVDHLVTTPAPRGALHVVAAVREKDGGWVVDLEMSGAASGTRTLRAATCTSVARATALIVALALDPQAAARASEELARADSSPPGPGAAAPPEPAPAAAPPERTPSSSGDERPVIRPLVFAGASFERALLPGLAPGIAVGGGLAWRALRVDASVQLAPRASTSLARVPGVGADFALASIAVRACVGQAISALAAHACTAVRGARISGEGTGLTEPYRQTAHLVALEPGVLLRTPGKSGAALELDAAAVLPLARPDFVILDRGPSAPLFRVSAVGLRVGLSATYRF